MIFTSPLAVPVRLPVFRGVRHMFKRGSAKKLSPSGNGDEVGRSLHEIHRTV